MNLTMVSLRVAIPRCMTFIVFDRLRFMTQPIANRAGRNHWEAWKLRRNPRKRSEVQRGLKHGLAKICRG